MNFYLRITADQYLDYYRGTARHVVVRRAALFAEGPYWRWRASVLGCYDICLAQVADFVLDSDRDLCEATW